MSAVLDRSWSLSVNGKADNLLFSGVPSALPDFKISVLITLIMSKHFKRINGPKYQHCNNDLMYFN